MNSNNPPFLNASDPDVGDAGDADANTDVLASQSKIDSKAEKQKETAGLGVAGLPVGTNKKDTQAEDAEDSDPNTDILAAEKKPAAVAVGKKKAANANREEVEADPFVDLLLASQAEKKSAREKNENQRK